MGEGQDTTGHAPTERVSVQEAADRLGTTVDAIRKRVQRRTIAHDKDPDCRVWILLDADRTRHAAGQDTTGQRQDGESGPLISEMRGRIEDLREQLAAERRANEENRRLLVALIQRIPELEAPQEPSEAPSEATEPPGSVEPLTDPGRPQLSSIFMVLSWIGVGSITILVGLLSELQFPVWLILSPLSLFVLPFIFGLYHGVWLRKRQEFDQTAGSSQQDAFVGNVGFREAKVALATGGGSAFVTIFIEVFARGMGGLELESALLVFVGSFLFFVFAVLIGSATGGQEGRHDTSRSQTTGGGLRAAAWWNPQLILGLIATIITAAATVFAAFLAG